MIQWVTPGLVVDSPEPRTLRLYYNQKAYHLSPLETSIWLYVRQGGDPVQYKARLPHDLWQASQSVTRVDWEGSVSTLEHYGLLVRVTDPLQWHRWIMARWGRNTHTSHYLHVERGSDLMRLTSEEWNVWMCGDGRLPLITNFIALHRRLHHYTPSVSQLWQEWSDTHPRASKKQDHLLKTIRQLMANNLISLIGTWTDPIILPDRVEVYNYLDLPLPPIVDLHTQASDPCRGTDGSMWDPLIPPDTWRNIPPI